MSCAGGRGRGCRRGRNRGNHQVCVVGPMVCPTVGGDRSGRGNAGGGVAIGVVGGGMRAAGVVCHA